MNKKDSFFEEISKLANYCDLELVKEVYYAMIKVVSRGLRGSGKAKLPDWGEFYLLNYAPRQTMDYRSRQIVSLGMKKVVKFSPNDKVKEYFKGL